MNLKFLRNVFLKALALFVLLNVVLILLPERQTGEQLSVYNSIVPGRVRFPFGETPQQAYNFSLYDVDAMFAAHEVSARHAGNELRVFVLGDSSVWGTLLRPEETLSAQLNTLGLSCGDHPLRFYNLGYPTISVTKDLMLLQRAMAFRPDAVLWLTTLEAFPLEKQLASPLAANNRALLQPIIDRHGLPLSFEPARENVLDKTLWGRRRAIADWVRLQFYGIMYAATGVDQVYPNYTPAAWDLEADENYYQFEPPIFPKDEIMFNVLPAAHSILGDVPLVLVNEPIMISEGENSDVRYNFFYPRWVYDTYRMELARLAAESGVPYVDAWDWVDARRFTNSAIHMDAQAEAEFAGKLAEYVEQAICP